jgi:hypothetical protein
MPFYRAQLWGFVEAPNPVVAREVLAGTMRQVEDQHGVPVEVGEVTELPPGVATDIIGTWAKINRALEPGQ